MLAVLLVLVSLLFLVAPFLATVRNADQTSRRRADETAASLALDDAARLARGRLGASHPARDQTPDYDGLDELAVRNDLDPDFLWGDRGAARWDVEVEDLSGRVDLDTAPPAMIANLLGLATRLTKPLGVGDKTLKVASTAGFPERGILWVAGELIQYRKKTSTGFSELERGLGSTVEGEDALPGPLPARNAFPGAVVMDQRAWALAQWRSFDPPLADEPGGRREPRVLGSLDRLAEVADFVIDGDWGTETLAPLFEFGAEFGRTGSGPVWLPASRSLRPIVSGETDTVDVADPRWFNPGTTVRVHGDGVSELAIVRSVNARTGRLYLDRALVNDQNALEAVVEPQARRAVNVNTAPLEVLEALFTNLQLLGRNARITAAEARKLAEVVIASRPLTGFEDFVERVVLPSAGLDVLPADAPVIPAALAADDAASLSGFIDPDDALALYRNALCANDIELATSTMPLRFTSRDIYRFDLRVSVTAASGIERLERVREEVQRIAPSGPLMRVWSRQEDFDEELRLTRRAKLWNTGPNPTTRFDSFLKTSPPSRFQAHLGTDAFKSGLKVSKTTIPQVERTFADRESEGWIQPWASRIIDTGIYSGHVAHFDWEPETNLGRDLRVRPLTYQTSDPKLAWTANAGGALLKPITFSAWIRPRTIGGYMLDLGGNSREVDRISLFVEGSDLVLRVRDGAGDHPATTFLEFGEVRYPLNTGPGLPADTWSHVVVDVRGNRPDQMLLMVDARPATKTPGLTRLVSGLSSSSSTITVESTNGFPDPCVLRIGNELIEARVTSSTSFAANFTNSGPMAGFGGRLARERFSSSGGQPPLVNNGLAKTTNYAAQTPVELYGYSLPIKAGVSSGSSNLQGSLGPFAVARAYEAIGGASGAGDSISWLTSAGNTLNLGTGIEGATSATGVRLMPADLGRDPNEVMSAFSQQGGYAVFVQLAGAVRISGESLTTTVLGSPLFNMEVFHYSGWSGDELYIDRRGDQCKELTRLLKTSLLQRHAFVLTWYPNWTLLSGEQLTNLLNWQTFVVPISIPAIGGGGGFGFPQPLPGLSEFAQLTRISGAEMTEWVRYDEVVGGQLVRSDPAAMSILSVVLGGGGGDINPPPPPSPPPTDSPKSPVVPSMIKTASAAAPPAKLPTAGAYWDSAIGLEQYNSWPLSYAVQTQLEFRGVMGTYTHKHPAGTLLLPVFRLRDGGVDSGQPGRLDQAFFMDYDPLAPGWPVTVHRAYRPGEHLVASWVPSPDSSTKPLSADSGQGPTAQLDGGVLPGELLVAMQAAVPIPIAPGVNVTSSGQTLYDIRETSRLVLFPSGERPRRVDQVLLGGNLFGGNTSDMLLDEAAFLSSSFGLSSGGGLPVLGSSLILTTAFGVNAGSLRVQPFVLRRAGGIVASASLLLDELPNDAGLLRIGNELVCYASYDAQSGNVTLASNGRGMLGTKIEAHAAGESVTYIDVFPVSQLSAPVSSDDADLNLESVLGFGSAGLVRIQDELAHYTSLRSNALTMPRMSEEPGARDGKGGGLFRGRFGTRPGGYSAGEPVVGYPFRFWDRWSAGADAPELSFFGFEVDETDAYWRSVFWTADYERNGAFLGCLLRTDPSIPWDADPETTDGLYLLEGGEIASGGNPLGFQSSRVEARLFSSYNPGAFDPLNGISNGWKQGPRARLFGFEYLAPGAVLERTWK